MTVSEYVARQVSERLNRHSVVVWYDAGRAFGDLAASLQSPGATLVSAQASILEARRAADDWALRLDPGLGESPRLLIYIPWARSDDEKRVGDPFEVYVQVGAVFGAIEAEELESLACQALPGRATEIRHLFRAGRPSLAVLNELESGRRYPLLRQALGTDAAIDVAARLLAQPDTQDRVELVPGAAAELWRLMGETFGFAPPSAVRGGPRETRLFFNYVLFSEFAADLAIEVPETLAGLPRATSLVHVEAIRALCDVLRSSDASRDPYIELATSLEQELGLRPLIDGLGDIGDRDTFPVEDSAALAKTVGMIQRGEQESARSMVEVRRRSVWRSVAERALGWRLTERALEFTEAADAADAAAMGSKRPTATPRELVAAYVEHGWELDRRQRTLEQVVAEAAAPGEFGELIASIRKRYRTVAGAAQDRFLAAVERNGWPPDGLTHHTEVFERAVERSLADGRRIAFFLVDAMRYEMGRDLADALQDLGTASVEPVATVIPTTTPAGMAALMPSAHGTWEMREKGVGLIPVVAGRELAGAAERVAWLAERYGERYADVVFDELIRSPMPSLEARLAGKDLLVIRTQEIDALGEGGGGGLAARRIMSDVLSWLRQGTNKLVQLGFRDFVFAADHGYVLLPEVAAGDVVKEPPGEWLLRKRRSRLGRAAGASPGVVVFPARSLGIPGDVTDVAVPSGFRVFASDAEFFHEGISLQECVVPLVTLQVRDHSHAGRQGGERVDIVYKREMFTSRIVGLKLRLEALLTPSVLVRVEAYESGGPKATKVGEAADCDARDERSGFIRLLRDQETQVPLRIDDDFTGKQVEIRVINADGPEIVFGRLTLKNGIME